MIQRLQTIFLLVVFVNAFILFFIPFAEYKSINESIFVSLFPNKLYEQNYLIIFLLALINSSLLFFSATAIIFFKKRTIQIKLSYLLIVLNVSLLFSLFLLNVTPIKSEVKQTYLYPAFLPILSIIACFVAIHKIKKDEELVRSADRLR